MKKLATVLGVVGAVCLLDLLAHLMLGVGFLYVPSDAHSTAGLLFLRFLIGVALVLSAAFVRYEMEE
jgi:hypothetical protein